MSNSHSHEGSHSHIHDRDLEDEESLALSHTLNSFTSYRSSLHSSLTHRLRRYHSLPLPHRSLLSTYPSQIKLASTCIDANASLLEAIAGVGGTGVLGDVQAGVEGCGEGDMEKVRSVVKQFARDWSVEGRGEREQCYRPIVSVLEELFPDRHERNIRVLVPGAGLARLAWELARAGFHAQANEFSYHMLLGSFYILNCGVPVGHHTIHPYVHSWSNHRSRENHFRSVEIPDVDVAGELQHERAGTLEFASGDFVEVYSKPTETSQYDAVTTCFFIDTAPNIVDYISTIHNLLLPGGKWVNLGPLLWHFENKEEGGIELTADEVRGLVERSGFKVEVREERVRTRYVGDEEGMLGYVYEAEFWVATKL
ncbi:hypothetical protein YB2330_003184 [Saitoella coloradoensis]